MGLITVSKGMGNVGGKKKKKEAKKLYHKTKTCWCLQGESYQKGFLMSWQLWWNPALLFILLIEIVKIFDCKTELFWLLFSF